MRALLASVILLAACGGRAASRGPAWPKSAGWEKPDTWQEDGGESLAPREQHLSAVETSDDAAADVEPAADIDTTTVEVTPGPTPDGPVPDDATPPPAEGEIIIEGEAPPDSNDAP